MERGERFYKIHQALKAGKCLPLSHFTDNLGISRATFKRDIEYLRDRYEAPILWDRERNGYRYDLDAPGADKFELPGFWLSAGEIHALLAMRAMLEDVGGGFLADQVEPIMGRLEKVLEESQLSASAVKKRIRILHHSARAAEPVAFAVLAQALLRRRRVNIRFFNRATEERTTRDISPQRLIHYRDNWYVDAWCHLRNGIRTFSLDAIEGAQALEEKSKDLSEKELDEYLGASYGIFSGKASQVAQLRFTPTRARWVSRERWHPQQKASFDADGHYTLEVPYGDDRELVMDILRHGAEVEVLGPPELRKKVAAELARTARLYS